MASSASSGAPTFVAPAEKASMGSSLGDSVFLMLQDKIPRIVGERFVRGPELGVEVVDRLV